MVRVLLGQQNSNIKIGDVVWLSTRLPFNKWWSNLTSILIQVILLPSIINLGQYSNECFIGPQKTKCKIIYEHDNRSNVLKKCERTHTFRWRTDQCKQVSFILKKDNDKKLQFFIVKWQCGINRKNNSQKITRTRLKNGPGLNGQNICEIRVSSDISSRKIGRCSWEIDLNMKILLSHWTVKFTI